jgi:hypothetical protein
MKNPGIFLIVAIVLAITILIPGCIQGELPVSAPASPGTGGFSGTGLSPAATVTPPEADITLAPTSPLANRPPDLMHPPILRDSPFLYTNHFTADPTVREVRLWLFSNDTCIVVTAPVLGGTTISEKKLRFVFDANTTKRLHVGTARIIIERPEMENAYGLFVNDESGDVRIRENGSESLVFNIHSTGQTRSGESAEEALSRAIDQATSRFPALEETLPVTDPFISVENPGDLPAGFPFALHGITNLGDGDEIVVTVSSSSFTPCPKSGCNRPSLSRTIRLSGWPGISKNWTFENSLSEKLPLDEYLVDVTAPRTGTKSTTLFTIRPQYITIDPVVTPSFRDVFTVTGTTNIPAGEMINIDLSDATFFGSCHQARECNVYHLSGSAPVTAGINNRPNTWRFSGNISSYDPDDEFLVTAVFLSTTAQSNLFQFSP